MNIRYLRLAVVVTAIMLAAGCGAGTQGFGVVLWPPDDSALEFGSLVEVTGSSDIESTYTVRTPEEGDTLTTPQWRIELFGSEEQARQFADDYEAYAETFAAAERQALPVRAEQDRTSQIVYRLRQGEEVKIVTRSDQPSDEAGFVDYWYEVLTRDGTRGWVFGYHLSGVSETGETTQRRGVADDPLLKRFLTTTWRPTYFAEMLSSGRVDLERFRAEFGLFPDPENRELRLSLPEQSATFSYDGWSRGRAREFVAEGAQFSVLVRQARDSISVQYTIDGEGYNIAMQSIERDIQEIRSQEQSRRDALYESLRSRGSRLVSDAYGTIRLQEEQEFRWEQFGRLVPQVVPAAAGATGRVRFDHFLTDELSESYEGALSFRFTAVEDQPVVFLYEYVSGGVRMAHVPRENIEEKLVRRESLSPVIIFFSFEEGNSE